MLIRVTSFPLRTTNNLLLIVPRIFLLYSEKELAMKTNTKQKRTYSKTYEGGRSTKTSKIEELKRTVLSCLLFEDNFYENGVSVADRIEKLIPECDPIEVRDLAIKARYDYNLRHVPLLILRVMAKYKGYKELLGSAMYDVISRADELSEFLAIYWSKGKEPLAAQVKKGLARAFTKFDSYQLAKYNREGKVRLKDVLFLSHAKPENKEQEILWQNLINDRLTSPDTWEVALSSGKNKKEVFTRLLKENKLGALAILRNLRNMYEANVNEELIFKALDSANTNKVLPMRFISAAKHAPQWEDKIENILFKSLANKEKIKGKTILLVDVSGSMYQNISNKSELCLGDTANALGILVRELCEDCSIYSFSTSLKRIPARRGFALAETIKKSQTHGGTYLFTSLNSLTEGGDRLIVITDEQSADSGKFNFDKNYVINVASYKHGINYNQNTTHINGWSGAILDYILEYEKQFN